MRFNLPLFFLIACFSLSALGDEIKTAGTLSESLFIALSKAGAPSDCDSSGCPLQARDIQCTNTASDSSTCSISVERGTWVAQKVDGEAATALFVALKDSGISSACESQNCSIEVRSAL